MQWSQKKDRFTVMTLNYYGYAPTEFFNILQKLKTTLRFIFRTIKRYTDYLSFENRKRSGRPRTVKTPAVIKTVKVRIQQNQALQMVT